MKILAQSDQPFRSPAVFIDRDREVALVEDCKSGDRRAMEALIRHFERPVYNVAFRMLGNADDASDVAQAVFLKLFENIHRFDPAYRLFSWIYRIAVNETIDQYKRREQLDTGPDSPASDDTATESDAARDQLSHEIQSVLLELSEGHRAVIVLRYFTGCSYREMSEVLSVSEKTVKSRLYSARQDLKSRLVRRGILSV